MVNVLLARILITYDFKFEEGGGVPREHRIASFRGLGNADVLFRTFASIPSRSMMGVEMTIYRTGSRVHLA